MRTYFIMGIHPILEMITLYPQRIKKIYLSFSLPVKDRKKELLGQIQKAGLTWEEASSAYLEKKVGSSSHQGIIAEIFPKSKESLKEFLEKKKEENAVCLFLLDSIYDPHNFGAILRACECFAMDGVCFSKNRGASLSPVISKTSSGASEIVPLLEVSNLAEAVRLLKKQGYEIIAMQTVLDALPIHSCTFAGKVAILLGSEGAGIQPLLQKLSDKSVYIPMKGKISSLNVSQAATIVAFVWRQQNLS